MGPANGVIAKMTGITPDHPTGTGWDIAIGVRWLIICIVNFISNDIPFEENIEICIIILLISGRMETHLHTRKTKMIESYQRFFL